jgi:16S rRNA processing protein RimM
MDRFIVIGEIVKSIGLKGELKLYPLINYFEPLLDSPYLVWGDGTPADVERHRQAGSCEAVKIRNVSDRSASESLVGRKLGFMSDAYRETDFPRPAGGLPFRYLGREVATVGGETVGTVAEVRFTGAGFVLVIPDSREGAKEILVPAVAPILAMDDELEGTLVIDPPEGLLDVQLG